MFKSTELKFKSFELVFKSTELKFKAFEHRFLRGIRTFICRFVPFFFQV